MAAKPHMAVYLHWPFCAKICPYCDFNVHLNRSADIDVWRAAFLSDMAHQADLLAHNAREDKGSARIGSVFFGGGTPSLMPPHLVADILTGLSDIFGFADNIEISLEANPADLTADEMHDLRAAGINRLSLGVQSFDDDALAFLGRTHTGAQAREAFLHAQKIFPKTSFDLIYALPDEMPQKWAKNLRHALELAPSHLSAYQLTIEPRTPFYKYQQSGRLTPIDEESQAQLYEMTDMICQDYGLMRYETSNHARDGHACVHNLAIWQGGDYLGLGPGAHGRLHCVGNNDMAAGRYASTGYAKPQDWLSAVEKNGHGLAEISRQSPQDILEEAMMFGLRLSEGIALSRLMALGFEPPAQVMALLLEENLRVDDAHKLKLTAKGRLVLDSILSALLTATR
ncbi:MAG: radical SAM family heme chaperone HemW [Parvibaculales bacterium]